MTHQRYIAIEVSAAKSRLQVIWQDQHRSKYPGIWLMNACDCEICGSTSTAVRHLKLAEIVSRPEISSTLIDPGGNIVIRWNDGHESRYDPRWMRCHCSSEKERTRRSATTSSWDQSLQGHLPFMDYESVANDEALHLRFLETIMETGFVILKQVPKDRVQTKKVASLVGLLKLSNYGIFELKAKTAPEIVGDTAVSLNLHTDEAYRIDVPAITLFHVLTQSFDGGESTLVDGLYLAEIFAQQDPEAFEILCTIPARFHRKLKEGRWFDHSAPIISRNREGKVTGIRLLDRAMAPVDAETKNIEPFYDAVRKMLKLIYAGTGMITIKLKAGEMLIFNNQRLMHGRKAFDPNKFDRHVRSCHVDLDEFHSSLRMAYRRAHNEKCWNRFDAATRD